MKRIMYRMYTVLREHEENCQFFDTFGILVQIVLGLICLSFLLSIIDLFISKKNVRNTKKIYDCMVS